MRRHLAWILVGLAILLTVSSGAASAGRDPAGGIAGQPWLAPAEAPLTPEPTATPVAGPTKPPPNRSIETAGRAPDPAADAPDRLIVTHAPTRRPADLAGLHAAAGGVVRETIPRINAQVVEIDPARRNQAIAAYRSRAEIVTVEPDRRKSVHDTPNDPRFRDQWALTKVAAPAAWDVTRGSSGTRIAVLDCGMFGPSSAWGDLNGYPNGHPDVGPKIVLERDFTGSFTGTDDYCNHGTHVAGIAAAIANNGIGVAGLGREATLLNGKVLNDVGDGWESWEIQGIVWATDNGAKVINMSFGSSVGTVCSTAEQAAVNYARSRGVVVIASAGNEGRQGAGSPANCGGVIAVGATAADDGRPAWSNYGPLVDVAAPGAAILSTNYDGRYESFSGTSMAAPLVSGLAALIWSSGWGTGEAAVSARLLGTADRIAGTGSLWSAGRINAARAVQAGGELTCAADQYQARYYAGRDLAGAPLLSRCETSVDHVWGVGGPGGGVPTDNFSVAWTGRFTFDQATYRFSVRADDGVRVSIDGRRVIDAWRDQPATMYTVDRDLMAGEHEIRVEYYERGGAAVVQFGWTKIGDLICPTGQFRADYWTNVNLQGSSILRRCEPRVDFDWHVGSPSAGVPADHFSARWAGRFGFETGSYRFTVTADDGVRVWIDGVAIVDAWRDQPPATFTSLHQLTGGDHEIRIEYYERGGSAVARVAWEKVAVPATCPTGQYLATYYNNRDLAGPVALGRCEGPIDHGWGDGGPGAGVPVDHFSARWTGRFHFAAGTYQFTTRSDDGVRLFVDGVLVIDAWRDQPFVAHSVERTLTAGEHEVRVEYYERAHAAAIQVGWPVVPTGGCPDNQFLAEYFAGRHLGGTPLLRRCETRIDGQWGFGGPGSGVPDDDFSVRWTGRIVFDAGTYAFTARADDGIRVSLDGSLIIDGWRDQAATSYPARRSLMAGPHNLIVEYYERRFAATATFEWTRLPDG